MPHLAFTENSTQIDFVFDHLEISESSSNARLAIELATVVSEPNSRFTLNVSQSLDDEYTPGVFKVITKIQVPFKVQNYSIVSVPTS